MHRHMKTHKENNQHVFTYTHTHIRALFFYAVVFKESRRRSPRSPASMVKAKDWQDRHSLPSSQHPRGIQQGAQAIQVPLFYSCNTGTHFFCSIDSFPIHCNPGTSFLFNRIFSHPRVRTGNFLHSRARILGGAGVFGM